MSFYKKTPFLELIETPAQASPVLLSPQSWSGQTGCKGQGKGGPTPEFYLEFVYNVFFWCKRLY